jgi:anti-sigma regulatory factor (Ser/Thr protein kinase)
MMAGAVNRRLRAVPTTPSLIRAMVTDAARIMDPPPGVLADIRLAATEAATNAVKHAYPDRQDGPIDVTIESDGSYLRVVIRDYGHRHPDARQAWRPSGLDSPSSPNARSHSSSTGATPARGSL